MSYGSNPENLATLANDPRYRFVKGDIRDRRKVEEFMAQVDVVVNFAAETHVDRSISSPSAFLESNVVGTQALLEAARRSSLGKFVQISTDEVYGSAAGEVHFDENTALNPSSPYAASKAAADFFVRAYHKTYGLPVAILRCTNNFGPRQFPEKFIPKTIILAMLGRKVAIYGNGLQVRDWIYVEDFCNAINLLIDRETGGTTYNVSAGNELTNIEVAKRILRGVGKDEGLIQYVEDRPGHDVRYSLNSNQIREELGWKPRFAFDDALDSTINWYLANEKWWKPLLNDKVLSSTPWKENW
jgi:dTDP-glucose 4,6-dehydratase